MITTRKTKLAQSTAIIVMLSFVMSAILAPPDPFSQILIAISVITACLAFAYVIIYKSNITIPSVRWGDLFRWFVSTLLFWMIIALPITIFTTLDEGTTAPYFQLVVLAVGAVLAGIVVWTDTVPWPGATED